MNIDCSELKKKQSQIQNKIYDKIIIPKSDIDRIKRSQSILDDMNKLKEINEVIYKKCYKKFHII
jgi:hypothetical protein